MSKKLNEKAEKRLRRALKMKNFIGQKVKDKNRSMDHKNEFFLEMNLAHGAELRITDWTEYHVSGISINKDDTTIKKQVLDLLQSKFGEYKVLASSLFETSSKFNRNELYRFQDFILYIYPSKVWFYSNSLKIILAIETELKNFEVKTDKQIYLLTSGMDGVTLTPSKSINEPLLYENYEETVAAQLKKALVWSQELKPNGRILIMSGPPGTGKSYAIRGLISESTGIDWALIPSYLVAELASPHIIASLINERVDSDRPLNLIVEDADNLLKRREENNPDIISQVLNLGDGMLGELINVKLIMTTNCPRVSMDEAIIRRGRLNSFIDFKLLPPEQANTIYNKIARNSILQVICNKNVVYDEPKALCDIYADAYDQEVSLPKKKSTGNYL